MSQIILSNAPQSTPFALPSHIIQPSVSGSVRMSIAGRRCELGRAALWALWGGAVSSAELGGGAEWNSTTPQWRGWQNGVAPAGLPAVNGGMGPASAVPFLAESSHDKPPNAACLMMAPKALCT